MNVLQVNNYGYVRGGSDACYLSTQALLRERGHHVCNFNVKINGAEDNGPFGELLPDAVNLSSPGPADVARFLYSPLAKKAMSGVCERFHPDIAHLHIYYGQLTTSIIHELRRRSVPVVQTLHEFKLVCPVSTLVSNGAICTSCAKGGYWHAAVKRCNKESMARSALSTLEAYISKALGSWRNIDHFVAVSDFLREKMIEFGLPAEKVTTVHNFIDANNYAPSNNFGDYFLYFGRLEKIKGVMTLLEAMRNAPGRLLVVGEGQARPEMESYAFRHGMNNVEFLGYKKGEDLYSLIRNSRCVVAPSEWYETFGLVAIEAFVHARPVLASNIGGLKEIVADNEDGRLVMPGDAEALSEALRWFWSNPRVAVDMGRSGRIKVERQFNASQHYDRLMSVYQRAMG